MLVVMVMVREIYLLILIYISKLLFCCFASVLVDGDTGANLRVRVQGVYMECGKRCSDNALCGHEDKALVLFFCG